MNEVVRRVELEATGFDVVELLAGGGSHLVYFLADAGPEHDRRAASDRPLSALSEDELGAALARGASLTVTERRFRDEAGEAWLVQNVGPVWGDGGSNDGEGLRFVQVRTGAAPVLAPGGHVGQYTDDELRARLAAALQPPSEGRSVG